MEKSTSKKTHVCCPNCNMDISIGAFKGHLKTKHNLTDVDWLLITDRLKNVPRFPDIPQDVLRPYLQRVYDKFGKLEDYRIYSSQFTSYYRAITHCHNFVVPGDIDGFFDRVLPWKLLNPGRGNSRELCETMFPNDPDMADRCYRETMLAKNPFHKHDGSLSPWSKSFVGYSGMTDDEKEQKIRKSTKRGVVGRDSTSLEYWLKKGLSIDKARQRLHDRQQTFSLEKCIAKYGEEDGRKRWKERQTRWQNTLNAKTEEEKRDIKRRRLETANNKPQEVKDEINLKKRFKLQSKQQERCHPLGWSHELP